MKFKRFLASVLSVLMLTSALSFVSYAQEAAETVTVTFNTRNGAVPTTKTFTVGTDTVVTFPQDPSFTWHTFLGWSTEKNGEVLEGDVALPAENTTYYAVYEQNADWPSPLKLLAAKNSSSFNSLNPGGSGRGDAVDKTAYYDATSNVIYKHFYTTNKAPSVNMYSGLSFPTNAEKLYIVTYFRTNITGGTQRAGLYTIHGKDGGASGATVSPAVLDIAADKWVKNIYVIDNTSEIANVQHIDFSLVGEATNLPEDNYLDVAALAFIEGKEEAESYDIAGASTYDGEFTISFDAHLTEDDDTDVYTKYPENLTNGDNAFLGWTLDPDADKIELVDITRLAVPTSDAVYHAVWSEQRTLNFYKNDGTDDVETLVLGKGASLEAPKFTSGSKLFLGWSETADGEIVTLPEVVEENKDYYAIWRDTYLTSVIVNGNNHESVNRNGSWYGIENLKLADRLDFVMPYGYPTSVIPTIEVTANEGEAVYAAPQAFDGEGSVTVNGVVFPVTFTVAGKDSVENMSGVPTASVDAGGRGAKALPNNTEKGISATKYVPVYSTDSEYYVEGSYVPTRGTNPEGWGVFPEHNVESYKQYRVLIYYDTGADGAPDTDVVVNFGFSDTHTRGTLKNKYVNSANKYKYDRWEYIYFNVPEGSYSYTKQIAFQPWGNKSANSFHDDTYYIAEIAALVDADEKFLQYAPVGLDSVNETDAKNDGMLTGIASDMEISVDGGEYALATTFEGFDADAGVISGLAPAEYSVRFAGNDQYAPSEVVELVINPDSVEIYFEDGDEETPVIEQIYEYNAAITAPTEEPKKAGFKFAGWALGNAETAYDFTTATATAELDGMVFNALWTVVTDYYVNGSAPTSGDGLTPDTAFVYLADAWNAIGEKNGTIYIVGDTKLMGTLKAQGGDIVIRGLTGEEVLSHAGPSFNGANEGKVTFEHITINNATQWSNFWNFYGMEVEFGEDVVVPVDTDNNLWPIVARAGGESGATLGRKIVIRSGEFSTFHLGSKGKVVNADVDFELRGGKAGINLGNDSVAGGTVATHGGTMTNVRALFDVKPTSVYMQWIHTMTGALQLIANNGVDLGNINMNGVTPQGGTYRINSAEGGRVDFTDTIGKYKITTDMSYAVITDANGTATKYSMATGSSDAAELYGEDKSIEVTLGAGVYDVTYTNEGLSVSGEVATKNESFEFVLNAENNYSATIPENVIADAAAGAKDGYKFSGYFASADGKYTTENGVITITEYTPDKVELAPVYEEDDTLPYYHMRAFYNDKAATLAVTISIANGKFVAGTVGFDYDSSVLARTGSELSPDYISHILGGVPEIFGDDAVYDDDALIDVWNAAYGSIDATEEDVDIMTYYFNVIDTEAFEASDVLPVYFYDKFSKDYTNYFEDKHYMASPVNAPGEDEFAVNFVKVYCGEPVLEKVPTELANVTIRVNMPEKAGATDDNIAHLYYHNGRTTGFIPLESAGNELDAFDVNINDTFYVGEEFTLAVVKNGYISALGNFTIENIMVLEATLLGGDIKDSFDGDDALAFDKGDYGDGKVTLADFVRVVRAFDDAATPEYKAIVDINEDGAVNVTDIGIVKQNFGKTSEDTPLTIAPPSYIG